MKPLKKQSGNIIDLRDKKDAKVYEESRGSLKQQQSARENLVRDAQRVIPKKVFGFSERDMEKTMKAAKKQDRLPRK